MKQSYGFLLLAPASRWALLLALTALASGCPEPKERVVEVEVPVGACAGVPDGTSCDDADPCTAVGMCQAGTCVVGPLDCRALDDAFRVSMEWKVELWKRRLIDANVDTRTFTVVARREPLLGQYFITIYDASGTVQNERVFTSRTLFTAALEQPEWCAKVIAEYGDRVAIGLDVRGTTLAARGWTQDGGELFETLSRLDAEGCARYVVTDVRRDGTLTGPNLDLLRDVCAATDRPVVASGGVSTLDDLRAIAGVPGVEGAIVGKALYAGAFTLPEALAAVR